MRSKDGDDLLVNAVGVIGVNLLALLCLLVFTGHGNEWFTFEADFLQRKDPATDTGHTIQSQDLLKLV